MKAKTNETSITVILILTWILIAWFLLGCSTVKKEWVKETFTEKETTASIKKVQDSTFKIEVTNLKTSIASLQTTISKNETTNTTTKEDETTTVSGSITAEDGKEKSVTIGNTTIKSNGANISFETSSTKSALKEVENQYSELFSKYESQMEVNTSMRSELVELKTTVENLKRDYQSRSKTASKDVKRTGFTFGFTVTLILILLAAGAVWYFRKSIPFLNR